MRLTRSYSSRCVALFAACVTSVSLTAVCGAQVNSNAQELDRQAARRAAIASARGQLEQAQARLKAAEQRVKANSKASPEMAAAETELKTAQAELDAASGPVLETLKNDPAYQAVLKEEADAAKTLGKEQAKAVAADPASTRPTTVPAMAKPDDDTTVAQDTDSLNVPVPTDGQVVAAADKLGVRSKRRDMELAAIAADAKAGPAQAKVDAATTKLKALRAQYEATLLNDPDYRAARDQLAAARAEVTRAAGANY